MKIIAAFVFIFFSMSLYFQIKDIENGLDIFSAYMMAILVTSVVLTLLDKEKFDRIDNIERICAEHEKKYLELEKRIKEKL